MEMKAPSSSKKNLMIKVIPALDILNGKCVRLTKGSFEDAKVYDDDPIAVAKRFAAAGVKHLHLVDLDGAKAGRVVNYNILKEITRETDLEVEFGGGIKSDQDLAQAFAAGAQKVTIGTLAVKNPKLLLSWLQKYGNDRIILGADVLDGIIRIDGWKRETEFKLFDFITNYQWHGIQYILCTDIDKDGMMQGSSLPLYASLLEQFPDLKFIANGGISSIEELQELDQMGCYAAVVGKALYEGKISLEELANFLSE